MRILFLNLASNSSEPQQGACIACVSETKTEAIRFIDHRIGDSGVVPVIEEVLKEAGWSHKDITNIACVTGPGGFTSLRMGVSLANVFADQLGVPRVGVHLSDLYHARVGALRATPLWVHSTKKTHLFVRGFTMNDVWNEPTFVSVEEFQAQVGARHGSTQLTTGAKPLQWCGELIPEHASLVGAWRAMPLRPIPEILPAFLAKLPYTQELLTPWYGRGW